LVLVPWLIGWEPPPLVFDAILHLGTLLAILAVFWRDVIVLLKAWFASLRARRIESPEAKTAWLILVGTIPAALIGYLMEDFFAGLFAQPFWVGVFLLITGGILALSEWMGTRHAALQELRWGSALLIGFAQAGAIAPGISRSGATIAAGMARGLGRATAARFSFLLAIPIMLGAGGFKLLELVQEGVTTAGGGMALVIGFLTAALCGFLAIRFLLAFLQRQRLYVFAVYCWIVGALTIVVSLVQ
jgi:undecaprenyl-diphosphatase